MTIKDIEILIEQIAQKYGYQVMPYNCDGGQSSIMCNTISDNQYEIRLRTAEKDKYDVIKGEIYNYLTPFNFNISNVIFDDKNGFIMIRRFIIEEVKATNDAVQKELCSKSSNVTNYFYNIDKISKSQVALSDSKQDNRKETNTYRCFASMFLH